MNTVNKGSSTASSEFDIQAVLSKAPSGLTGPQELKNELDPSGYTYRAAKVVGSSSSPYGSIRPTSYSERVLKTWSGTVTTIDEATFQARMRSSEIQDQNGIEYFDIDINNVADGDIGLLREGAQFYLSVVSMNVPGQGPAKSTRIVFRRIPRMTAHQIARSEAEADELMELLRPGRDEQLTQFKDTTNF